MIDDALLHVGNNAQRMVMTHAPRSAINVALKDKAHRIDVGVSRGDKNGRPEVVEIIDKGHVIDDAMQIRSSYY